MAEIKEVDFGVANTYKTNSGHLIEINPKLNDFPELKQKVLEHELEHTRTKGFWKNRKLETHSNVKFRELIPFYKKYPKTFLQQYSPIIYKDNTILFEWSLIFYYTSLFLFGWFIFWIVNTLSNDINFLIKVGQYMFWIFFGSIGLLFLGKKLRDYINEEAKKTESRKQKTDIEKLRSLE